MNKTRPVTPQVRHIIAVSLFAVILSACNSTPTSITTQVPEPSPSPTAVPTLASLPAGGLVYGDLDGRFSLPLVGEWAPVETDDSYGHFRLAEPVLDMYVVTVESEDLDTVVDAAIAQIGLDPAELSQLAKVSLGRWTAYLYKLDSDRGVSLLAQRLGDASIAVIATGELSVTTSPPADVFLTLDGLAFLPLAEYLAFQPPPAPSTVEDIENLNNIDFYNGRTKLVGKLVLPEGDGPFPAIVCVHGSAPSTRTECDHVTSALRASGLAVFSYDKRGVGQSEGIFVGVTDINDNPSPSEWRMPQLGDDALAAVTFLQNLSEINPDQIGLIGASQAGSIIPQVAARSAIPAFAVTIVGQTVPVGEAHYYQQFTGKERRLPPMTESERDELSAQLAIFDGNPGFDPRPSIEAMKIPALWIWGDLDGWIPPRKSRLVIAEHDKDFTIIYDPDFGHEWPSSLNSVVVDWILAQLEE
jgi:pimeloyl-ACP methyl ester carboxylesterase